MDALPTTVVTAIACSAAAGKNPWIPLGLLLCLAAPETVPGWIMDPEVHAGLHGMAPPEWLYGLGGTFLVLATLEAFADKISWVERWLTPISTTWRPFAGVAVAGILGVGAANVDPSAAEPAAFAAADASGALATTSTVALTILAGTVAGYIATVAKTGIRLGLSLIPVPGLRLAHSFLDDLFAVSATVAGIAFGDTVIVAILAVLYLVVGMFTGPVLARLALIHLRIGWGIVRRMFGHAGEGPVTPPAWLAAALRESGVDPDQATFLPAYVYRAPVVGYCRAGFLVLAPGQTWFATRAMWQPRILKVDDTSLTRFGLAQTTTHRVVSLVSRTEAGGLLEALVYLFPAEEAQVVPALEQGARRAGLLRVRVDSESARRGLPGFAQAGQSVRYIPADEAGNLRAQAVTTLAAAIGVGVLSGGVFVPIGAGYAISPFKRRFVVGLLASGYLSLCVIATFGLGWPAAVLYGAILNAIALRDLTRQALRAQVDGFLDLRAFVPAVCDRAWVPRAGLLAPSDRWTDEMPEPLTDGPWRAVVRALAAA